jgi:hypothetical protein
MKRCQRCVLPETVPGITINEDGICSFCLSYQKEKYLGEDELKKVIASTNSKNNSYDCIVPISGGRDSTYLLYLAKKIYNLRVLAVSYDNEFRTEQPLINMKKACKILNIDFLDVRSKRGIAQKRVKHNICSSVNFGQFGFCAACTHGIRSVVYRAAEEHKVPLIFWGHSQQEATQDIESKAFEGLEQRESKFSKLLNINFYKGEYYWLLHRIEFHVPGNNFLIRNRPFLKNGNIQEVRVFDYIPWNRREIKEVITTKLGWEPQKGSKTTWHTDCKLHPFMNYSFFKLFGCSKDCFGYCNMINSGEMERAEALKQEEAMAATHSDNINELLENTIGLPEKIVTDIESFPSKLYQLQ